MLWHLLKRLLLVPKGFSPDGRQLDLSSDDKRNSPASWTNKLATGFAELCKLLVKCKP
jgi:hypothetical protein